MCINYERFLTAMSLTMPWRAAYIKRGEKRGSTMSREASEDDPGADDGNATYKVGYGRPPKDGQFKKGKSGNPAGAPKRAALNLESVLERTLADTVPVRVNRKEQKMTALKAL